MLKMRDLEVQLNGNRLCSAGIDGDDAVLNAIVDIVGQGEAGYHMRLTVCGLGNEEFLELGHDDPSRRRSNLHSRLGEASAPPSPKRKANAPSPYK